MASEGGSPPAGAAGSPQPAQSVTTPHSMAVAVGEAVSQPDLPAEMSDESDEVDSLEELLPDASPVATTVTLMLLAVTTLCLLTQPLVTAIGALVAAAIASTQLRTTGYRGAFFLLLVACLLMATAVTTLVFSPGIIAPLR